MLWESEYRESLTEMAPFVSAMQEAIRAERDAAAKASEPEEEDIDAPLEVDDEDEEDE